MTICAAPETFFGDGVTHFFVHRATHDFVEIALAALQFGGAQDDVLRRQFGSDFVLATAQQEGFDTTREQIATQVVAAFLDRGAPAAREVTAVAEKAGQQEVELRPQLTEMIFHRRAGDAQAVARVELADDSGRAAGGVLDGLCFVENQQVIVVLLQLLGVAPHEWIGGQDNVMFRNGTEVALRAMQNEYTQRRCNARGFALPVEDQRGGHDDEARAVETPRIFLDEQMGQGLCRFAQSHVIREYAAQIMAAQVLQPGQPFELVRPQRQAEPGRRRDRCDAGAAAQARRSGFDGTQAGGAGDFGKRFETRRIQPGNPQAMIAALFAIEQIDEQTQDWFEARCGEAHALAVF